MKKVVLRFSVVVLLGLASCTSPTESSSDGGGGQNPPTPTLTKFNIAGAKGLVIMPASAISRSVGATSTLNKVFKLTDSGALLEVTALDETGAQMTTTMNPVAVTEAGNDFLAFCFGGNLINVQDMYLVRKSDGAVFQVPKAYNLQGSSGFFKNLPLVQSDTSGKLYWHSWENSSAWSGNQLHKVVRVDSSTPTNLTATNLTPTTDAAYSFLVNPSGDLLYRYSTQSNFQGWRILKHTGGLKNLPSSTYFIGMSLSGDFFYKGDYNATSGFYSLETVSIAANGTDTTTSQPLPASFSAYSQSYSYLLRLLAEQYVVSASTGGSLTRVESSTHTLGDVSGSPLTTYNLAAASSTKLYLAGHDTNGSPKLVTYDPSTNLFTTVFPGTDGVEYDLITLDVSSGDSVLFNALRMSDGKKVIGKKSAAGTVTIVDDTYNAEVVSLIQVN